MSASAPTCKLNDSASLTSALPCWISNTPLPLSTTLAPFPSSVPMELALVSSSAISLYAASAVIVFSFTGSTPAAVAFCVASALSV